MLNSSQLADLLKTVNVLAVAKEANVSPKTVYRLRHMSHSPTLGTVLALLEAVRKLKAKRPPKACQQSPEVQPPDCA